MVKRALYPLLSVALLLSLVVVACQSGWVNPTIPTTGGIINLYGIDPLTLDPALSGDLTSHEYILQLYGGLVSLDNTLQPVPNIARSWQISADGKTYTFYLRHDVKFHNGRGVKAEDFQYSWERAANPDTGSQTAATYLGDIVGVKQVLAGETKTISGVRVIDDYTIQVTIDAPKSYFLSKLTYPTSFVVDKDSVKNGKWWRSANGTGPFKLKQWEENKLLVLERNELYYGERAKVDSVVFSLWSGIPMNLYETGKIDVTGVSGSYIYRVTDKAGPFYRQLAVVPELSFSYIGFNATKPPFDDANIRRAFSQAVDKDKLVSLVFHGTVQRAEGILPPGMPGFNAKLSGLKYDVTEARRLLAASKYGDASRLPPITLTTSGWGGAISQEVEALVYQWRQNLGVEIKVRQIEPERFLYHLKQEKDGIFAMGWVADYPHPQNFLEVLFRTGTDQNYGEYSNPEVDTLLDRANAEARSDLSLKLYQQAEQILVDDAAGLPLWFGRNHVLVKPYVKGYNLSPLGFVMWNKVSVERR